ncbi:ABC transporter substrate-binding protein [Marinitenerispora sediminis]|uniref:Sugar ABC transporter sugar-binding protein n=1 Tax=Marinitenerispora sediminis TaxID=1931232 RepID=A0A368TBS7_9ACTN|nr:extracellular solute-binding protein [Marinitenerispora sediminis]RCV51689.1 sugar ABC transporter sugar-binding protein [Marinitenerispora sediminis]RCV58144.1 sugar ABC transporter sugar-binding protein [Marinitenerispora sediminis]RCV62515.1 sugar ABC transporter sugar-binding protein [Marinitenerispora sediminis]
MSVSRHLRTRVLRAAAVGVALALAGSACAPSTDGGGEDGDGDVTLTVWSWRPEDAEGYERIFAAFEERNPGVTVEFRGYQNSEYPAILQTGLTQSSGGPDVVQLKPFGPIQSFIGAEQLVPLDDEVDLAAWPEEIVAAARGRDDGRLYGVPFAFQTLGVMYNEELFAEHGLEPPTTWQEMTEAAETLRDADVIPFATAGRDPWVLAILRETMGATRAGGGEFAEEVLAGRTDFTDPDYTASLRTVADLEPYLPEDVTAVGYTDAQTLFTSGRAAMYPGGSYELAPFATAAPDLEIGYFDAPPAPDAVVDTPLTPGFADGSYGVNAASPHRAEAVALVEWMATEEFGRAFAEELRQIPAVPGVAPADPLLAEMRGNYEEHGTPYMMSVYFGYGEPLGRDAEGQALADMLLGRSTEEEAGARIQREISAWFEPTG